MPKHCLRRPLFREWSYEDAEQPPGWQQADVLKIACQTGTCGLCICSTYAPRQALLCSRQGVKSTAAKHLSRLTEVRHVLAHCSGFRGPHLSDACMQDIAANAGVALRQGCCAMGRPPLSERCQQRSIHAASPDVWGGCCAHQVSIHGRHFLLHATPKRLSSLCITSSADGNSCLEVWQMVGQIAKLARSTSVSDIHL